MNKKRESGKTNDEVKRFNRWAATYDQSILQRVFFGPIQMRLLDCLTKETPKEPSHILDVGCGTGRLLRTMSYRWPNAELFGVDPAEHMIAEATRLNSKATFKVGFAEALPLPDQTFDVVVTSLSFHHWSDQSKGIQEIARVLCGNGLFCLVDHIFPLARLRGERVKSRKQIQALINEAGLKVKLQRRLALPFILITLAQK